jgi:hypothetical protein
MLSIHARTSIGRSDSRVVPISNPIKEMTPKSTPSSHTKTCLCMYKTSVDYVYIRTYVNLYTCIHVSLQNGALEDGLKHIEHSCMHARHERSLCANTFNMLIEQCRSKYGQAVIYKDMALPKPNDCMGRRCIYIYIYIYTYIYIYI